MWYTPGHTLTHNAIVNMVIGPRGAGKTYGLKLQACKNFIKKGEQFIYLRRYKSELQLVKENLFADINENEDFDVEFKDDKYYINNQVAGYAMALSISSQLKSASFPKVTLIIFDEFIIDSSDRFQHYLSNEVRKFLDLYETVARLRENVKAFLLANSLSFINPYTIYWRMKNPENKKIVKANNGLVLCELWSDENYTETKLMTKFGQLVQGTEYGEMSVNNKFILDSDVFISSKHPDSHYLSGVIIDGREYSIWSHEKESMYYCCHGWDRDHRKIAFTIADHQEDTQLQKAPIYLTNFFTAFRMGRVRFEDMLTKSDFMEVFRRWK